MSRGALDTNASKGTPQGISTLILGTVDTADVGQYTKKHSGKHYGFFVEEGDANVRISTYKARADATAARDVDTYPCTAGLLVYAREGEHFNDLFVNQRSGATAGRIWVFTSQIMAKLFDSVQITDGTNFAAFDDYDSALDERLDNSLKTIAGITGLDPSVAAGSRQVPIHSHIGSVYEGLATTVPQGLDVNALLFARNTSNNVAGLQAITGEATAQNETRLGLLTRAMIAGIDSSAGAGSRGMAIEARDFVTDADVAAALVGILTNSRMAAYSLSSSVFASLTQGSVTTGGVLSEIRDRLIVHSGLQGYDTTQGVGSQLQFIPSRVSAVGNGGIPDSVQRLQVAATMHDAIESLHATAAAGVGVTLTIPAVASKRAKICALTITAYASLASGLLTVTTTNLSGVIYHFAVAVAGEIDRLALSTKAGIEGDATNVATTIVCPGTPNVTWCVTAHWYDAA